MTSTEIRENPHRRYNPLTGEWLLVSPHRAKRPWQGKVEEVKRIPGASYESECYLCPGNIRANGERNPEYTSTYVFENDFSALLPNIPKASFNIDDLIIAESEEGICKVVCFSPNHSVALSQMPAADIRTVIDTWSIEYKTLGDLPNINYVQIFENKGDIMGCSNPHPHGQIWAQHSLPNEVLKEQNQFTEYFKRYHRTILEVYALVEVRERIRLVDENEHFITVVPFWAVWPFETMIIPKRKIGSLLEMTDSEKNGFAESIHRIAEIYDRLFATPFPYSSGIHQMPVDGKPHPEWHLHMHFYPPLLRSATVKKFMVGYEMLGAPQRDITPEIAAQRLRESAMTLERN